MNWVGRIALFATWVILTFVLRGVEGLLGVVPILWWALYFLASMVIFAMLIVSVGEDMG